MVLMGSPGKGACKIGVVELYIVCGILAAAEEEEAAFNPIAKRFLVSSSVGTPFFSSKPYGATTPGFWTRSKPGAGAKGVSC